MTAINIQIHKQTDKLTQNFYLSACKSKDRNSVLSIGWFWYKKGKDVIILLKTCKNVDNTALL